MILPRLREGPSVPRSKRAIHAAMPWMALVDQRHDGAVGLLGEIAAQVAKKGMLETRIGAHPNTTWLAMLPCACVPAAASACLIAIGTIAVRCHAKVIDPLHFRHETVTCPARPEPDPGQETRFPAIAHRRRVPRRVARGESHGEEGQSSNHSGRGGLLPRVR